MCTIGFGLGLGDGGSQHQQVCKPHDAAHRRSRILPIDVFDSGRFILDKEAWANAVEYLILVGLLHCLFEEWKA
jgi:hypothetical protein